MPPSPPSPTSPDQPSECATEGAPDAFAADISLEQTAAPEDISLDRTAVTAPAAPGRSKGKSNDSTRGCSSGGSFGRSFGRYILLEQLGAGGMGEVFSAFDPELDRKIALKVLHPRVKAHADAAERLLREARILAKISHPNVVPVYDVGTVGDDVYIAMEHVRGSDLRAWSQSEERDWQSVVRVLVGAGHGLVAAHSTGLIHRDFKPDNVIVDENGRARVIDFGIARLLIDEPDQISEVLDQLGSTALDSQGRLTQTGALIGTPAYMAPEQFEAQPADERSDQFAFCATLYEALAKERPHAGSSLLELAANVTRGDRKPLPASVKVPKAIAAAIDRGMSLRPEDRFDSITELLAALVPAKRRSGRVAIGLGLIAIAAVGGFVALDRSAAARPQCVVDNDLDDTLNESVAETLATRISKSSLPYAAEQLPRIEAGLQSYKNKWLAARRDACEATAAETQSVQDRDLRMACLDRRERELKAVLAVLSTGDDSALERAVATVSGLTPVDGCSNVELLRGVEPLGHDVETSLANISALSGAGKTVEAGEATNALLSSDLSERARGLALVWASRIASKREGANSIEHAFAALRIASRLGDRELAADAWIYAARATRRKGDNDDAERWAMHATIAIENAGGDLSKVVALGFVEIGIYRSQLRHAEALARLKEIEPLTRQVFGPDSSKLATLMATHASLLGWLGRPMEALEMAKVALDHTERIRGKRHSAVAFRLNTLAICQARLKRYSSALKSHERALSIKRGAFPESHLTVQRTLFNRAGILERMGQFGEAEREMTSVIDTLAAVKNPRHEAIARRRHRLGDLMFFTGQLARAKSLADQVVASTKLISRPDLEGHAHSLACRALVAQGDARAGVTRCELAINLLEKHDKDDRILAEALTLLAEAQVALGNSGAALANSERAMELRRGKLEHRPFRAAEAQFIHASVLMAQPNPNAEIKAQALRLATEARDMVEQGHPGHQIRLPAIVAFLNKHGPQR